MSSRTASTTFISASPLNPVFDLYLFIFGLSIGRIAVDVLGAPGLGSATFVIGSLIGAVAAAGLWILVVKTGISQGRRALVAEEIRRAGLDSTAPAYVPEEWTR